MQHSLWARLDWFVPDNATSERSDLGLARSFVIMHLVGPCLIFSIVIFTMVVDPQPSLACWAMLVCVAGFWALPFGLRASGDLQLMALVSVELLCVLSLIGTFFYGGVNSPYLPWLLVSLMLGFFYLSDHARRVLALFGCNIVAVIALYCTSHVPERLTPAQLTPINWWSTFTATVFMSMMAIYYAGIVTMRSKLERDTEQHRLMAQRLRTAKQRAEVAMRGKTAFLTRMKQQFEGPLQHVASVSSELLDRSSALPAGREGELARIRTVSLQLLGMVREAVDQTRLPLATPVIEVDVPLVPYLDEFVDCIRTRLATRGGTLMLESDDDLGFIRVDTYALSQIIENVLAKAAGIVRPPSFLMECTRRHDASADWVHIRIKALQHGDDFAAGDVASALFMDRWAQIEAEFEMVQLRCAVIGAKLTIGRDTAGSLVFTIDVPCTPLTARPQMLAA